MFPLREHVRHKRHLPVTKKYVYYSYIFLFLLQSYYFLPKKYIFIADILSLYFNHIIFSPFNLFSSSFYIYAKT